MLYSTFMGIILRRSDLRRDGSPRHQLLIGAAQVRAASGIIEGLRRNCRPAPDPITAVDWFLSRTAAWRNTPLAVILHDGGQPVAAALFSLEQRLGLPTGLVRGGNGSGDGLLVASGNRIDIVTEAVGAVFGISWVHTVLASVRGIEAPSAALPGNARHSSAQREIGTHLSLEGGFDGYLSRLGSRSRRNHRYYRRRGEAELGLAYLSELGPEDAVAAVTQLHAVAMHPAPRTRSMMIEAAIRQTPGSFAQGVRLPDGRWVSYLAGWRQSGTTFVEWQLNDHRLQSASLSTVMRTCMIEHEAALGVEQIVFVGGTSPALGRYCAPDRCLDLLVTREGLRGQIGRMLMTGLSPRGQVTTMIRATD